MKHISALVQRVVRSRWEGGHHDSCRVIAGEHHTAADHRGEASPVEYSEKANCFVLPAILASTTR